jgi:hypothetical protein
MSHKGLHNSYNLGGDVKVTAQIRGLPRMSEAGPQSPGPYYATFPSSAEGP